MAKTSVWYGESGTFKTTNLYFAAKYLFAKHKKPIRMITAETWEGLASLVEVGIVDLVQFTPESCNGNPLPALVKLSRGWWPIINDKGIKTLTAPGLKNDLSGVCAYFFEGLTSASDVLMTDERNKHRKHSEEPVSPFVEDDIKFCAPARSHYNFVQSTMLDRFADFSSLPVDRVIFTAHEAKGEDEDTKDPIRGPGLVGKAGTDKIGRKVGACIHFEKYVTVENRTDSVSKEKLDVTRESVRAFFLSHPDKKFPNTIYKCKPRVAPEKYEELLRRFPGGYVPLTLESGMDLMLKAEDELAQGNVLADQQWKDKVLGGEKKEVAKSGD